MTVCLFTVKSISQSLGKFWHCTVKINVDHMSACLISSIAFCRSMQDVCALIIFSTEVTQS